MFELCYVNMLPQIAFFIVKRQLRWLITFLEYPEASCLFVVPGTRRESYRNIPVIPYLGEALKGAAETKYEKCLLALLGCSRSGEFSADDMRTALC